MSKADKENYAAEKTMVHMLQKELNIEVFLVHLFFLLILCKT